MLFIFIPIQPSMILINVFLSAYCKKWLNKNGMQQWQSESISKDFTRTEGSVCVHKDRVPLMEEVHGFQCQELSILGYKPLFFM